MNSDERYGYKMPKGKDGKFISLPLEVRFWRSVNVNGPVPEYAPHLGPCWLWTASLNLGGYGKLEDCGHTVTAHRVSLRLHGVEIPKGKEVDHLCRVRNCVNPAHLEPVTSRVNQMRGNTLTYKNSIKTHCLRGHEFNAENTYFSKDGHRSCKKCWKITGRRNYLKNEQPRFAYA